MGSISSKERIDLSPRTLTLTSVDDKVWLGIPEENLFNDSFTIEKYYMLQSRPLSNFKDLDHFNSIEQLEQSFFPSYKDRFSNNDGTTDSDDDDFMGGSGHHPSKDNGVGGGVNDKPGVGGNASGVGGSGGGVNTPSLNSSPSKSSVSNVGSSSSVGVNSVGSSSSNAAVSNTGQRNSMGMVDHLTRTRSNSTITNVNNPNNTSNSSNSNVGNNSNSSSGTGSNGVGNTTNQSNNTPNNSGNSNINGSIQVEKDDVGNNNGSNSNSTSASSADGDSNTKEYNYKARYEEYKNRQSIPVYLIDEDPFHTHQITTALLLEDLYAQSNVNTAYYTTLLQKRLSILKRIHLALKREIARKKTFDSVVNFQSKTKTRTKKIHPPPISIRIACRLFITTLQEQVFEQRISLPTLQSFNGMIRELPPLSMAGEPADCIDSLTNWLLSAISTNMPGVKREAMESLISLALSQGSLSSILFSLSLIIMPEKISQQRPQNTYQLNQQLEELQLREKQQQQPNQNQNNSNNLLKQPSKNNLNNNINSSTNQSQSTNTTNNQNTNLKQQPNATNNTTEKKMNNYNVQLEGLTLRLIPFIRQLEQWKVDLPLSPLSRDLLFSTWPIQWNDNALQEDSLAFLSLPNSNIATITSDGEYIYLHDACGLAKIGTGYHGTHQGRVYARDGNLYPKEKGWMAVVGNNLYYRSPSIEPASMIVLSTMTLQEIGRIHQDGSGSFRTTNNLTLPFGAETIQSSVDESIFLTPHLQVTTRSPLFTDGRYIYLLTLQRFHGFGNKQLIVDMYDPYISFKHIKRVELRYPDSDVNEDLVLNPMVLELGSFYTNGHYLMVVIPPPLGTDYSYDGKSYICRAFSLSDGSLLGNYCLENQPIGIASFYDYLNNVIWNYSSSESEIGKFGNEGFGPKHNFPSILFNHDNQNNNNNQNNSSNNNNIEDGNQKNTIMVESDDNQGMDPKQVVSTVLGILSRLAVDYMPSNTENNSTSSSSTIHQLYKLTEPYSVEVNFTTFSQLYSILKHYQSQLRIGYSMTSPKTIDILRCIIYCLRLLRVNLFRLTSNIRSLESNSQQNYQDSSRDSLLKCVDQTFLSQLRDLLMGFIVDGIEGSTTNEIAEFNTIIEESCEVLTIGLDLFYPTSLNKANFVFKLLDQVMSHRRAATIPPNMLLTREERKKKEKERERERGYSMLLNSVLALLANHPNASFFALPPLLSELPLMGFTLFNPIDQVDQSRPFDPMNLFVPIIQHLLVEANATIPKQAGTFGGVPNQLSRQDSSQHLGFSLYSSAPPPPLSASSPSMRLLLAVQKDLILRVENSTVGTDAPSQALVAYSRLLMDKCKELLLAVLESGDQSQSNNNNATSSSSSSSTSTSSPSTSSNNTSSNTTSNTTSTKDASTTFTPQQQKTILLTDFKSSVVGALLPTLIHSLFLFSYHIWLAKELLPSLIQLIGVVDRVNRRLPKLLNRPELGRQPIQKRSSFVEGPSRISESPHPYHPFMNSRQVVSIPGAVFLSLVFDDRSSTSSSDDLLQIYESADSKEPLDQFSLSQWPKRRTLIPGDTVVFQFITGSTTNANPYAFWGYRCNIIGHMPNSDKTSLPWSAHLEKTMCCLAGRFSASLISGDPLTELEIDHRNILESTLFHGGVEEDYISHVLLGNDSLMRGAGLHPHPHPQPQPFPIETTVMPQAWKSIQRFCVSLARRNGELFSTTLSDYMWHFISGEKRFSNSTSTNIMRSTIKMAQQAVIASLIKHLGYGEMAINFAFQIIQLKSVANNGANISNNEINVKPPQPLIDIWKTSLQLRNAIIQKHQENQLLVNGVGGGGSGSIGSSEEESAKRRSVDYKTHTSLRETIYKDITDHVTDKALFLLELQSFYFENATAYDQSEIQLFNADISNSILQFTMSNLNLEDVKRILLSRRSRAFTRSLGLQSMRDILRCASDNTMKHEALCFIGPALRNSGLVRRRPPPFHYMDHLYGCGSRLLNDVKKNFRLMMEDIATLLQDSDNTLRIYALDAFTLNFTSEDADLLTSIDIFNKIHNLMTTDSIWGGMWSTGPSSSITQLSGGVGGASSSQSSNNIDGIIPNSSSSVGVGGNLSLGGGSGTSGGGNLFSNGSIYTSYVEEEKVERDKLKKNAKALFKFLGLICVDGNNMQYDSSSSSTTSSATRKSLDLLRDAFFYHMETQLENILILLQEQNKTYWYGSDLMHSNGGMVKSRRLMRGGERSSFNYDFSEGLSLLYILSCFNSVKQRLTSSSFINIFYSILQVGDETHRKLTLRIFRRILPYVSPHKLIVSTKRSNSTGTNLSMAVHHTPHQYYHPHLPPQHHQSQPNLIGKRLNTSTHHSQPNNQHNQHTHTQHQGSSSNQHLNTHPSNQNNTSTGGNVNNTTISNARITDNSKSLFTLLLDIVGAISYWGCSSDLLETSKYIDPRFFITSSNYNLFFSSNVSTKIDPFLSIFIDRSTSVLPTCWDNSITRVNPLIRFSDDSKIVTYQSGTSASSSNNPTSNNRSSINSNSVTRVVPTTGRISTNMSGNIGNSGVGQSNINTNNPTIIINGGNNPGQRISTQSNTSNVQQQQQQQQQNIAGQQINQRQQHQLLEYSFIKADNIIPDTLPLYYFEIKLESENNNCIIGLFPLSNVYLLKQLKEWRYGYGYNGKDGHKVCHRFNVNRSRAYANQFARNDVIGCGWNRKEGKVFFTRNGKYLGAAFKNVYGDFYPVIMISMGVSVSVNYGQTPFLYDIAPLTSSHLELAISEKNLPSMALSYVSEVINLLRLLMKQESWKNALQRYIEDGLKLLPSTIVADSPLLNPQSSNTSNSNNSNGNTSSKHHKEKEKDKDNNNMVASNVHTPTIQSLIHVFSVITLMAGHLDGIWQGARVQVELSPGLFEKGTIIEYSPLSNLSRILLDSNIDRLVKTVHHRRSIKPISDINIDFGQFLPSQSTILSSLSIFLRPNTINFKPNNNSNSNSSSTNPSQNSGSSSNFRNNQRNIYLFIRSRVMKILGSLLKHQDCARYALDEMLVPILVEFALGRPIQFIDEPKIETMERLSFHLKERMYDNSFKSYIAGTSMNNINNNSSNNINNNNDKNDIDDQGTMTEIDFDDDNEMMEEEEFNDMDDINMNGEDDDLLDINDKESSSKYKKEKKNSGQHQTTQLSTTPTGTISMRGSRNSSGSSQSNPLPPINSNINNQNQHQQHHQEEDENGNIIINNQLNQEEEEIVEEDIPDEGISGKRIQWNDITIGMNVMVCKREKLNLCRSNWVYDMDRIIGAVGVVKNIDKKHKHVLVNFLDEDTYSMVEWWLCAEVFIYPPPAADKLLTKNPLQSIDKYSPAQLVHLDASSELALSILFSRQALISLLVSFPSSVKVPYSSFGGAKNLIYILKLSLHTSLLNSNSSNHTRQQIRNTSITNTICDINANDRNTIKMLLMKLTTLIHQESQENKLLQQSIHNSSNNNNNSVNGADQIAETTVINRNAINTIDNTNNNNSMNDNISLSSSTSSLSSLSSDNSTVNTNGMNNFGQLSNIILTNHSPSATISSNGHHITSNNTIPSVITLSNQLSTSPQQQSQQLLQQQMANNSNATKWKSYKPQMNIPTLSPPTSGMVTEQPLKAGHLMKQQKILKKRVYVVLSSDTLFYYKAQPQASQTLNSSNLASIVAGSVSNLTSRGGTLTSGIPINSSKDNSNSINNNNQLNTQINMNSSTGNLNSNGNGAGKDQSTAINRNNSSMNDLIPLEPLGSIDLRDIVSVTQVNIVKQPKIFKRDPYCFQVTVVSNKTLIFQAPSQDELNEWLQIINSACISSAAFRSKSNTLSSVSLVEVLVKECSQQLRDTSNEPIQQMIEESPHPYPPNYKVKKIIKINGALSLLVVFDGKTSTDANSVLKFYYDPCCTDHIATYSGKISSFPPILISAPQFWMVFNSDSPNSNSEYGYKFHVSAVRMHTSDVCLLPQPNFEFACFLVDWLLQLEVGCFLSKYPYLYSNDLIDLLMNHLDASRSLDRRLKVITFITRVLQKQREYTYPPINIANAKLDMIRDEMFRMYRSETLNNQTPITSIILSQYLQRLIELSIHYEINRSYHNNHSMSNNGYQLIQNYYTSTTPQQPNNSQSNQSNQNNINQNNNTQNNVMILDPEHPKSWFYRTLKTYKFIDSLYKGKGFSREFMKEAFQETKNKIVVDSPHPYPQGVRVTANIVIPNAVSLKVEFDQRSKTQIYVDYLMFSKNTPGGDDLGFFTGDFPLQPLVISGDRFVWSFYSDSNEPEWGFRFTVTPIFTEEVNRELDYQYDQEIEYLVNMNWNQSLDLELVKFVNTICEKQKKTPSQLIFEQCCTTEYLILYPKLFEIKNTQVLLLRFIILKHFNMLIQSFIPYVDLRGLMGNEEWSMGSKLSGIRGLIFYETKMETLSNSLQQTRVSGRRALLYLNRHAIISNTFNASHPTRNSVVRHNNNNRQSTIQRSSHQQRLLQSQQHLLHQHYHQPNGGGSNSYQQSPLPPNTWENLFLQSYRQAGLIDPTRLRFNDRAWEVKLEREGARDAGGPYRETITQIITEIQSPDMNLFLPCHNAQSDVSFNRDKLVPNSSQNSTFALQLYEYIGRLIGIAIRTRNCIELAFPSIIWKQLVCAKVDRQDLESIDKYCTNMLEFITMENKPQSIGQEIFQDLFQTFTTRSIDGSIVELLPNGKNIMVNWNNRLEFVKLLEQYKLNEFKLQIDAMVRGVSSVVPIQLLSTFTWQELELAVCGMIGLDIKLLRRHTRYCGILPSEPRVQWFWRTLESFSSQEQTLFLRFVWGRSRLPPSNEFNIQFQLQVFIRNHSHLYDDDYRVGSDNNNNNNEENQDEYLPEAQTCFFTLSLPNYSSQEIMREKLLYAITTCRDIDADYIVHNNNNN